MGTPIKHAVPDRVDWASECPDVKNYKWRLNPVCTAQDALYLYPYDNSRRQRVNQPCSSQLSCRMNTATLIYNLPSDRHSTRRSTMTRNTVLDIFHILRVVRILVRPQFRW